MYAITRIPFTLRATIISRRAEEEFKDQSAYTRSNADHNYPKGLFFAGDWLFGDWFGWHGKKNICPIEVEATKKNHGHPTGEIPTK
jgi:hypothetical protein